VVQRLQRFATYSFLKQLVLKIIIEDMQQQQAAGAGGAELPPMLAALQDLFNELDVDHSGGCGGLAAAGRRAAACPGLGLGLGPCWMRRQTPRQPAPEPAPQARRSMHAHRPRPAAPRRCRPAQAASRSRSCPRACRPRATWWNPQRWPT
jgi:hypothetical protein